MNNHTDLQVTGSGNTPDGTEFSQILSPSLTPVSLFVTISETQKEIHTFINK